MKSLWLSLKTMVYAAGFLGVMAFWLPLRIFERHAHWPEAWAPLQFAGAALFSLGAAICIYCAGVFVFRGRGTPAPFDPPERFVRRGPYKWVRNPMYLGLLALVGGEGLLLQSWHVAVYWVCLVCTVHIFVVGYEEDALRR